MKPFTPLFAIPLLALGLAACVGDANPNEQTMVKENRLAAAGFKKRPISSEAQLADFKSIPSHLIRPATWRGKLIYIYADPNFCGCLYVGGRKAYQAYIQLAANPTPQHYDGGSPYFPTPYMLDGGPWDDADMYGMYVD